jgi:proteasome accessory factor A
VNEPFVPAVIGTETEFGITIRHQPDFNPVVASSMVINSYAGASSRIQWSFDEESPGRDARGFGYEPPPTIDYESGLVNVVLGNGARFYVDHAHPEYSTPECVNALQAALHDKAGELVMARAVVAATPLLAQTMFVFKNR